MAQSILHMTPANDEEIQCLALLQEVVKCAQPHQSKRVDGIALQLLELYRARAGTVQILKEEVAAVQSADDPSSSE